jgi:hypothetical protein
MQQQEYFCYHSPGRETRPVDLEKPSLAIVVVWGFAAGATLLTTLYTCIRSVFYSLDAEGHSKRSTGFRPDKKAREKCATVGQIIIQVLMLVGVFFAVVWIIQKITGSGVEMPIRAALYVDLEKKMFPVNVTFGGNATHRLVPEEPLPDGLQWWHILCVGCGSFCGGLCSIFGCDMWCRGECTKNNEYRLEHESSDSEASTESESESESDSDSNKKVRPSD